MPSRCVATRPVFGTHTTPPARCRLDLERWPPRPCRSDRKSTRLNSSHLVISYAVFCLKKKKQVETVTSALSIPAPPPGPATPLAGPDRSVTASWPETPPGADTLSVHSDECLAATCAQR